MSLVHREVTGDLESLKIFSEIYFLLSKNPLEIDYLETAEVHMYLDKASGLPVGGFVLNSAKNKRYIQMLPENEQVSALKDDIFDNSTEITCIWLKKSHSTFLNRYFFYNSLFKISARKSKKFVIGGSYSSKVRNLHMMVLRKPKVHCHTFYRGKGIPEDFWIYYEESKRVYRNFNSVVPREFFKSFRHIVIPIFGKMSRPKKASVK